MAPLIQEYSDYLTVTRRLQITTVNLYVKEIERLLTYFNDKSITFEQSSSEDIVGYLIKRSELSKLSSRTLAKIMSSLTSFYRFLIESERRFDNPMSNIDTPKIVQPLPKEMKDSEIERFL